MSSKTVLFDGSGSRPTAGRPFSLVPVGSASVRTESVVVSASARSLSRLLDEDLHEIRIERLAGFLPEQPDGAFVAHRLVIGAFRRQRVEVIHHRQDAGAGRDLVALHPRRVSLAVPPLVVAQNQRRDRVGERHAGDDFGADLRVDANLLELFLRQRTRLRENVLGDGQLADVVQQGRRLDALNLVFRHADRFRETRREHLHAPDVRLARAILGVNRQRERLDRRQVQVRDLLHMALLVLDAPHVDLVAAIREVERRRREQSDVVVGGAADDDRHTCRCHRADEVARRAPEEVLVPHLEQRLVRRQGDRRRDESGVAEEIRANPSEQRLGHRGQRHRREPGNAAQGLKRPARGLNADHQARHAE